MHTTTLTEQTLKTLPLFGIAGNFADHLTQAGEDADFVNISTEGGAPKGIFPIYIPKHDSFLNIFPVSSEELQADFSTHTKVQMEPEVCVLLDVGYANHQVTSLEAKAFSAFNDCSIRRPNARKISEKKNWGAACTGLSQQWVEIDRFDQNGILNQYRLTSFLKRDGQVQQYGVDSPVSGYQYFNQQLIQWMIRTLNTQQDNGPLEPLLPLLASLNYPPQIIITLGATRYTPFGETGYLKPKDQIGVMVYHQNLLNPDETTDAFTQLLDTPHNFEHGSALVQSVKDTAL